jgi:hypothetical protein
MTVILEGVAPEDYANKLSDFGKTKRVVCNSLTETFHHQSLQK